MSTTPSTWQLHGTAAEPSLLLRRRPNTGDPVLYAHGATFPSALSVAYRFEGHSWMDNLHAQGFDAWAFDFAGYGGSARYDVMSGIQQGPVCGRAAEAADQIARVVAHIETVTARSRVSIVAHSWGTIAAGLYAARHPECIARLCLFGPIAQRDLPDLTRSGGAWQLVTIAEQLERFIRDVPPGHPAVLLERELAEWGPAYLASDPDAQSRSPAGVKIPGGPDADIVAAWSGQLPYRPEEVRAPTLVVRGEWDSVSNDADAKWLLSRLAHPMRRDAKIAKGTHLMHLERSRDGLFTAVNDFLRSA